ncbi:MAG TPA: YihY/virulence factor BrkB family protein, partial [Thermomicrobiales bacterium]|nr:YihY/virulence factor BrkB family protein [Thermomicrobiales bacterium]
AITARQNSGWLGVLSFITLAWVGTGFVSCLSRCMNRIYGARPTGYIAEKQRGFLVLLIFSLLFLIASLASVIPTFLASHDLPGDVDRWLVFSQQARLIGYVTGLSTALLMFLTLYRIVPNAGQRIADVWPGTVLSALVFLAVTQVFPLYINLIGGANRYGLILGFVSLLVLSLIILAHIILFGAYVNAAWQRRRRLHRQRPLDSEGVRTGPYGGTEVTA